MQAWGKKLNYKKLYSKCTYEIMEGTENRRNWNYRLLGAIKRDRYFYGAMEGSIFC